MDCPEAKRGGKVEVACPCPPDDSLVEIFSRLPAKPLFRFKCVSKDWRGLITDRLRCRKFPQTLQGFLAGQGAETYGGFIDVSERPVPLVDPSSFSFLTKLPEFENIVLFGSCNGLVLFGRRHRRVSERYEYDSLDYIVCNPATEEWVSVPSSGYTPFEWDDSDEEGYQGDGPGADTYLIFDPAISPHFQLIQLEFGGLFEFHEVRTFSSATGAWRLELEGTGVPRHTMSGTGACLFNGMLHVGAYRCPYITPKKHMIVAVGGEGRPCRALDWPQDDRGSIVFFGQSQGHLHCLSGCMTEVSEMTELSIWVLEDYNAEKWVLRDNVSLSQLFKRTRGCSIKDWNVVGIHPDRGLVFFVEYWNRKLISYDMDKKEVRALCSLHGYHRPIIPYVPYFAQSAELANKN